MRLKYDVQKFRFSLHRLRNPITTPTNIKATHHNSVRRVTNNTGQAIDVLVKITR